VYPTNFTNNNQLVFRGQSASAYDLNLWFNTSGQPQLQLGSGAQSISTTNAFPVNTWSHIAYTYDGVNSNIYLGVSGTFKNVVSATTTSQTFNPAYGFNFGTFTPAVGATNFLFGNLADVRVSNVARYVGSSYTVPSAPFSNDANTLLLLKSLAGQTGTTLEVQGRGLNSVSLGAGRVTNSYPPAPMSSYLLDTTSNASVSYGQGKYVASASSDVGGNYVWNAFYGRNKLRERFDIQYVVTIWIYRLLSADC
jgi:hypothetical protein